MEDVVSFDGHLSTEWIASVVMSDPSAKRAPAVAKAIEILDYLANRKAEAGVSVIATDLGMNKSTCYNILQTLAAEQMVVKDSRFPVYRLGPRLVELGTASRRQLSHREQVGEAVRPLVEKTGLTCCIAMPLPGDRGTIVVDRIIPRRTEAMSIPIGWVGSITAPAMGRVVLAGRDIDEVMSNVRNFPDVDLAALTTLVDSLDVVREKGYGWSDSEFQPGTNAVAAPIRGADREVALVLCMFGDATHFPSEKIDEYGRALVALAAQIESRALHAGLSLG